jgi:hypothetical protein
LAIRCSGNVGFLRKMRSASGGFGTARSAASSSRLSTRNEIAAPLKLRSKSAEQNAERANRMCEQKVSRACLKVLV